MTISANAEFRPNILALPDGRYGLIIAGVALEFTFDELLALRDEANLALGLTYANYAEFEGR